MSKITSIIKEAEANIPTQWGDFRMIAYKSESLDYIPEIAMVHPDMNPDETVVVRIHSECLTGDLFHSQRCDCGNQLDLAMQQINNEKGVLIYMRQEGRGIGIINKLKAYNKQDEGMDTIEAKLALGLKSEYRSYEKAIAILNDLNINSINLLTNNPDKLKAFDDSGIVVNKRVSIEIKPTPNNKKYLFTKKTSMGHMLKFE